MLLKARVAAAAAVIVALVDLGHYYQNGPAASWRKGARGERKTARALAPLAAAGYVVLHDRAIPNSSANIDHIMVGPGGVWVLDSKAWHRRTVITGKGGALQIGSRSAATALKGVDFERGAVAAAVNRATRGRVSVGALVVVHGARLPRWAVLSVNGVPLVRARRARSLIRSSSPALGVGEVLELGQLLDGAFPRYVGCR